MTSQHDLNSSLAQEIQRLTKQVSRLNTNVESLINLVMKTETAETHHGHEHAALNHGRPTLVRNHEYVTLKPQVMDQSISEELHVPPHHHDEEEEAEEDNGTPNLHVKPNMNQSSIFDPSFKMRSNKHFNTNNNLWLYNSDQYRNTTMTQKQ